MKSERGQTLVELIVGFTLLTALLGVVFVIYRMGAGAWKKVEAQSDLVQAHQRILSRLNLEAKRSTIDSVTLDPPAPGPSTAVALLSCWDGTNYDYDAVAASQVWHEYLTFYLNPDGEVRLVKAELTPPSTTALPHPALASLRVGGTLLAENITEFRAELFQRELRVHIRSSLTRYGSERPETLYTPASVFFRN